MRPEIESYSLMNDIGVCMCVCEYMCCPSGEIQDNRSEVNGRLGRLELERSLSKKVRVIIVTQYTSMLSSNSFFCIFLHRAICHSIDSQRAPLLTSSVGGSHKTQTKCFAKQNKIQ